MFDLKRYRKSKKLTQKELATLLDVDQSRISKYESGKEVTDYMNDLISSKLDGVESYWNHIEEEITESIDIVTNSTFVPITAKAGFSNGFDDFAYKDELEHFNVPYRRFHSLCVEVVGSSMNDTLEEGDILICDKRPITDIKDIKSGFIYYLDTKDGSKVKRVQKQPNSSKVWLESDNEAYEMIEIEANDIIKAYYVRRVEKWNLAKKMKYEDEDNQWV